MLGTSLGSIYWRLAMHHTRCILMRHDLLLAAYLMRMKQLSRLKSSTRTPARADAASGALQISLDIGILRSL